MNFSHQCFYPGCGRKFSSRQGLEGHIRQTHIIGFGKRKAVTKEARA